jgi:Protein of unknown function (DUF3618)
LNARVIPSDLSPDELQQDADRVRRQIGSTLERLRTKLTPRNIISEITEGSGMGDVTPRSVVDFAARRHPVSTVLVGLGLGVLAFSVLKSSEKGGPGALQQTFSSLAQSARDTFKAHAETKRQDFVRAAEAHLTTGAGHLTGAVEKGLEDLVSLVPAPVEARPLIESALQLLLISGLEAIFAKARK